ncbi:MAG: aspartyl protease family protein [Nitrososphaerota archaeon]|nr:aspartyl protease family protein [Candidatus Calditenuaceae archaeon]MDW8073410.1 aspartyl protease family protein [Nitrososphaerota archaeon]
MRGVRERLIKALVDTGASYLVLDPRVIEELGLFPTPYEVELTLADKRRVRSKLYLAEVKAEGRRGPVLVAELDVPAPLLGVFALEALGLRPNPLTGRLEVVGPEGGYLLQHGLFALYSGRSGSSGAGG